MRDKILYATSLVPFLIAFFGTLYLLAGLSSFLPAGFLGLYLAGNIFQAGACVGCPYRGRYCPPIFGVYLGNVFSMILYRNRTYEERFFKVNATMAEVLMYATILFPLYWLSKLSWLYAIIYLGLVLVHVVLFMPTQCEKCSYNDTCPGGLTWRKCGKFLNGT